MLIGVTAEELEEIIEAIGERADDAREEAGIEMQVNEGNAQELLREAEWYTKLKERLMRHRGRKG